MPQVRQDQNKNKISDNNSSQKFEDDIREYQILK